MGQPEAKVYVARGGHLLLVDVSEVGFDLKAQFMFRRDGKGAMRLSSLEISTSDPNDILRITDVRKTVPLGAWEEAARVQAAIALQAVERGKRKPKPAAESTAPGRPPYAEVARRYRELARAGVKAPAALIAEEFGVPPMTARNWLRQCRAYSLLRAAPAPGVAGEVFTKVKPASGRRGA